MKNRNRFCILLVMMLVCLMGKSQTTTEQVMPTIIPPAPTSAILEKFMGYPVSPATGLVNVGIPLYTLNCYDLNLPIRLQYHSSGIRIQDPVGFVARGWALTPGFKITRTVMGKPDEHFPVKERVESVPVSIDNQIRMAPNAGTGDCYTTASNKKENMDGQYDIFRIHLPSLEATFILKHINGSPSIEMMGDHPWKITPLISPVQNNIRVTLYGFEVQDDKGIKYKFGESSLLPPNNAYYSEASTGFESYFFVGWGLREVVFPNNEKITFSYQKRDEEYPNFNQTITIIDDEQLKKFNSSVLPHSNVLVPASPGYLKKEEPNQRHIMRYTSLVPLTILTPNETLAFTYNSQELFTGITVKNNQNQTIRTISCTHNTTQKLLKTVSINGSEKYLFDYERESDTDIERGHFDWWGYYTGEKNRPTYPIPEVTMTVIKVNGPTTSREDIKFGYANIKRDPKEEYIAARALSKITYPTGGTFTIKYEPHRFTVESTSRIGAGLRVKSTESYDPQSGKTIKKDYTYEEAHFTGLFYPDQKSLVTTSHICALSPHSFEARQRVLTVFPRQPYYNNNQTPVWYGKVTETTATGKTEYKYKHRTKKYIEMMPATGSIHYRSDYFVNIDSTLLYPAPILEKETLFETVNGQYRVVRMTENKYIEQTKSFRDFDYHIQKRIVNSNNSNCDFLDLDPKGEIYYQLYGSPIYASSRTTFGGKVLLQSTKTTDYLQNSQVVNTVNYAYVPGQTYNLSSKTVQAADGNVYKEEYYYSGQQFPDMLKITPAERQASAEAFSANFKTALWQQVHLVNNQRTGSVIHTHAPATTPGILYRPTGSYVQVGEGNFERRIEYKYDSYGNMRHAKLDNQKQAVYIWGYKGLYPVAVIENATLEQVTALIPLTTLNSYTAAATPSTTFLNALAQLRTQLPEAQVTLLQYKPGVGVSRIDSPRGIYSGYYYDNAGRLNKQTIHDNQSERTVQEYEYNYINR